MNNQFQEILSEMTFSGELHFLISGQRHLMCCSSTGVSAVVMLTESDQTNDETRERRGRRSERGSAKGSESDKEEIENVSLKKNIIEKKKIIERKSFSEFTNPVIMKKSRKNHIFSEKDDAITSGCVTSVQGTGIDIFFMSNKSTGITITIMKKGKEKKSYYNEPFLQSHGNIIGMKVYHIFLYIACTDGTLITINFSSVLTAARTDDFSGSELRKLIISEDLIFKSPCIQNNQNSLNNQNIDSHKQNMGGTGKYNEERKEKEEPTNCIILNSIAMLSNSNCFCPKSSNETSTEKIREQIDKGREVGSEGDRGSSVEGHVFLVGGGDACPYVRVIRPVHHLSAYWCASQLEIGKDKEKERERGRGRETERKSGKVVANRRQRRDTCDGRDGHSPVSDRSNERISKTEEMRSHQGVQIIATLTAHTRAVTQISIDTAGRFFFSGSQGDMQVCVWDAVALSLVHVFRGVSMNCMVVSNDCLFITSSTAPYVRVWSGAVSRLRDHTDDCEVVEGRLDGVGREEEKKEVVLELDNSKVCQNHLNSNLLISAI